jgi:hypothetical protein
MTTVAMPVVSNNLSQQIGDIANALVDLPNASKYEVAHRYSYPLRKLPCLDRLYPSMTRRVVFFPGLPLRSPGSLSVNVSGWAARERPGEQRPRMSNVQCRGALTSHRRMRRTRRALLACQRRGVTAPRR